MGWSRRDKDREAERFERAEHDGMRATADAVRDLLAQEAAGNQDGARDAERRADAGFRDMEDNRTRAAFWRR
ncbi:hypothetical protein ACW14Y_42905 [Kitasatospora sp. cg17-2]